MKILIPTQVKDIHATVVGRALAARGHEAVLWYGADAPSIQTVSLEIGRDGGVDLRLVGAALESDGRFDVIWLRRPTDAELPDDMHPSDRAFAAIEWARLARGVWHTIGIDAFWVNTWESAVLANSKSRQLVDAAAAGLSIPQTLFSSDPARIREFLRAQAGETIYKPFCTAQWRTAEGSAYVFTAVIDEDGLPDDDVLRLSPGIFQARIDKAYELRITIIGNHIFAVRLDSQALDVARVDWRAGTRAIEMTATTLPDDVGRRCRQLMGRLGLVFGCLDFIVTPAGEYVFIEVDQMGQFLWLEEALPQLGLLDAFCTMLIQARSDFVWQPGDVMLRFADFHDPSLDTVADAPHRAHVVGNLLDDEAKSSSAA